MFIFKNADMFTEDFEFFAYKSPIFCMMNEIAEKSAKALDEAIESEICKRIFEVKVDIDKEELIKALEYDRGQYEKGFAAGRLAGNRKLEARKVKIHGDHCCCPVCSKSWWNYPSDKISNYCPECGQKLLKEGETE